MTLEQVVAALGQPDTGFEPAHLTAHFARCGLTVQFKPVPGAGNQVYMVKGGWDLVQQRTRDEARMAAFKARTREGLGVGSTQAEVRAAFGAPAGQEAAEGIPGITLLKYPARGIVFYLEGDNVVGVMVLLRSGGP